MANITTQEEVPTDHKGLIDYARIPWTKIRWDFVGEQQRFDKKTKVFVSSMRHKIRYELLHKFQCSRIIDSEWRVRDEAMVPALKKAALGWKAEYAKYGIDIRIGVEPYATSEAGYQLDESFEMAGMIDQLASIDDTLQTALDKPHIFKDHLRAKQRTIELIGEQLATDFNKSMPRHAEASDLLAICQDKASQCEAFAELRGKA